MSKTQDQLVYRRPEGIWVNKRNGSDHAASLHRTMSSAVDAARSMLIKQGGGALVVKGVDGSTISKYTVAT